MKELLTLCSASLALILALGASGGTAEAASACGRITTFADGISPTRELHVTVNGNDFTADGSLAKPFATVNRAAQQATPGTAIRLHAGTYRANQYAENVFGTAAAPIWIGGAPGEARPVISGAGLGFLIVKARYVVFHDMEIHGSTGHALSIHDGGEVGNPNAVRSVVFRNLNLHDAGGQCLKMAGVNDFRILNSQFARCTIVNIDGVGCHNGLIANSTIESCAHGIQFKGGSYNVEIRWNRIKNITNRALNLGGSTGFTFFRPPLSTSTTNYEARDLRAVANIIEDSKSPVVMPGCVGCYAINNTIVNPNTFIFRILQETKSTATYKFAPAGEGRFFNNVIYFNRGALVASDPFGVFVNVGPNTAPTTFQFRNNLWYAFNDPAQSTPTDLPVAESNGIYGENPNFLNPGTGSYAILTTSPAAGAGVTVGSLFDRYATGDFEGSCWAVPPSIGAYEATTGALSSTQK